MAKKADAWKEYKEAALVDMMMKVLPQVVIAENNFFFTSQDLGEFGLFLNSFFISLDLGELGIFLISGCCRGRSTIGPSREGENIEPLMKILIWTYHTVLSMEK